MNGPIQELISPGALLRRLLLAGAGVAALFFAALVGLYLFEIDRAHRDEWTTQAEAQADLIAARAAEPARNRDKGALEALCARLVANGGVRYAEVLDRNGRRVAGAGAPPGLGVYLTEMTRTVRASGGAVRIGFERRERRATLMLWGALVAGTALALWILVQFVVYQRLLRPLDDLVRSVKRGRSAETEIVAAGRRDDEVGALASALAQLLAETDELSRSLHIQRRELDTAVANRTAALESANKRLQSEIEDRRKAEESGRLKSEFLANMSHEIRTPMNVIIGMTEMALAKEIPDEQRRLLRMVADSADSLLRIINDILDFSKIEAGQLTIESQVLNLPEVIEASLGGLRLTAEHKGLSLALSLSSETPKFVYGDPVRLRQVLTNLVANALKFTEEGRVDVLVDAEPLPDGALELRFIVRDTGIGIPPEQRRVIFDAFQQADGSTTRRFGGTGLGLAISRQLVELMGGRIWVRSEEGMGSRFQFTLRTKAAEALTSDEPIERVVDRDGRLHGVSALICLGERDLRDRVSGALEAAGCLCVTAQTLEEAGALATLTQAAGRSWDLALLSPSMSPEGRECLLHNLSAKKEPILGLVGAGQRQAGGREGFAIDPRADAEEIVEAVLVALSAQGLRAAHGAGREGRLRVLVVEDLKANRTLLDLILQEEGFETHFAVNGREAVEKHAATAPDLILMDIQMPVMDGIEATAQIRKSEAQADHRTPIIAVTANAMRGDRERFIAAGMDAYVPKPIRRTELIEVISRVTAAVRERDHQPAAN